MARRQGVGRQAATKESEQEQTEKTEWKKLCRKCRVFADSTAGSLRVWFISKRFFPKNEPNYG